MKEIIVLLLCCDATYGVMHSLKYLHTASSGMTDFPEYVVVGMLDGVKIENYDSITQRWEPKQDWMNQVTADDPQYWEGNTGIEMGNQQLLKVNIETLKQRFNQTGGVHIVQQRIGCEWDDETGQTYGHNQYVYNGEDFLALDMKTMTYVAAKSQAVITQQRWNNNQDLLRYTRHFITQECDYDLKKFLDFGKSYLQRTVPPTVSLLQKTPSSPVCCLATGFYPDRVVVFWRKDGEELHEEVDPREILPNHDGTFQKKVVLTVKPEDWEKNRYDCVVRLAGVEDDIITRLERSAILTNHRSDITGYIVGAVVAAVVLLGVIIIIIWKKTRTYL